MKKKLLALAVAGAFVAPAAMADTANVNVYGVMNMSYDSTSTGTGCAAASPAACVATQSSSQTKVSSNTSRIGFKGTEDLGGGMNALFQIETLITPDAATATSLASRNSFVGLSGDSWGTVLIGTNDTPYKSSTRGMDLFGDTIADNRTLMGGVAGKSAAIGFDGRSANMVQYDSPNLSGFKVSAQYVAGAEAATSGSNKGSAWSLSGSYAAAPFTAALAYETHDIGSATSGTLGAANGGVVSQKERSYKLAGGYAVDQFAVNLVYEKTSDGFGAAGRDLYDHRSWYLSGKFNVTGSDSVKLAYTNTGNVASAANTSAKQISVGYDHAMSKRTTVYALYTKLTNDSAQNYQLAGQGTATVTNAGFDADPSAFSLGIKHTF